MRPRSGEETPGVRRAPVTRQTEPDHEPWRWAPPPVVAFKPVRPRVRLECISGPRPCPWTTCKHHLADVYLAAHPTASLDDMPETCVLDLQERGGASEREIARALGLSKTRVHQLIVSLLAKLSGGMPP